MTEQTYSVTLTKDEALAISACVEACCLGPNPVGNIQPAVQEAALDGMTAISAEMMKDL